MKRLHLCVVPLLLLVFAGQARSQGTIAWATNYPATGSTAGSITVSGTVATDSGWFAMSTSVTVRIWQDGLVVTTTTVPLTYSSPGNYTWGASSISGLISGAIYNVTVEATVINMQTFATATLCTAPATATAD